MKRWLLVVLLVLLMPLQAGWAAVGAYCVDGLNGLDGHVHQPSPTTIDEHADEAGTAADCEPGCSHCHGHGLPLPASLHSSSVQQGACAPADEPTLPDRQALAPRPERPQWFALA